MIDSTDLPRMDEVWSVFGNIVTDERVQGVPLLVLANKQDSEGAVSIENIKEAFNKNVSAWNISEGAVIPISALTGCGVSLRPVH